ncbi:ComEC/Rec2 family competence protein [Hanstruepera ponticola]|uniref:ComEC/Rec2 family competence protein n=1 Tax=Hanstruepera ponticola TaxID=2042995 RepID=UPI000CF1C4CE|nr:ComEC/Rec2 family competence protein [Hanstruepera ponticola]
MKLLDFPIVKLVLCLVIGIIIGQYITVSVIIALCISCSLLFITFIIYLTSKRRFTKNIWFGLFAILTTLSIGILVLTLHNERNFKNHYTHTSVFQERTDSKIVLSIREVLKPSPFHDRYFAEVIQVDSNRVRGKVQLNITKDSLNEMFQVDDKLIVFTHFQTLKSPLNPHQFNYKTYLENHNVYAQIYSDYQSLFSAKNDTHSLKGYAHKIRQKVMQQLESYNFKPDEMSVIKALLLGYRLDIKKDLYDDYINSGAVHILAISGLHIGIILLMLNFILGFLKRFKYGLITKTVIILILLWSFATIAGLSPSILRAATMFSALAVGMNLKRPHNIYNTLAISAFLLLLWNPFLLFEVGFQLSYLAVIGIVSVQPMLYALMRSHVWLIDKIWELITVSIAAQVGIFPLCLYYFHQFPGLFFIANVVIIPFLGIILGYGFIIIILAVFQVPKFFLFDFYESIIHWMNLLFKWIAKQESFLFTDISMNWYLAIGIYLVIMTSLNYFKRHSNIGIVSVLCSILILQSLLFYNKWQVETKDELVIFNKTKHSIIGFKNGKDLQVFHDLDSLTKSNDKIITSYRIGEFINSTEEDSLKDIYQFKSNKLLIIDSLGVYYLNRFKPHYVLLRNSPKVNLNRVIDSLQPHMIIADGSNYKSYVQRWKETALKRKLPFHATREKGVYILNLK